MKPTSISACFLATLIVFLFSCNQQHNGAKAEKITREKKPGQRMTDFAGALEYEFNLVKDPATGTIPEGIREMELAQAREILQQQSLSNNIEANNYLFQGPNNLGGRTRAIAYDVRFNGTTNQVILAGGVSGGVYKSTDNGATWVRKSPTGQHYSCTSIAQDPRPGSQDTWYYGVGEASGNSAAASGAFYGGNGIYKSTDNGETWTRLPNSNTTALETFTTAADFVNKVIVDPTNGNVYMACPATILRSTDGGMNWATVLSGALSNSGQFTDIVVTSGGRFYAGFSGTNAVGADGVWTSTTGASASWTRIAGPGGTPTGWNANAAYGRVVLGIAPSNEDIVYALYWNGVNSDCAPAATEAELFRWDNATTTWTNLSTTLPDEAGCSIGNDPFAVQGGYDLIVAVKPDDASVVFIGGTNIYRSVNSGASWTRIGGYVNSSSYGLYANSHPDIHAITFQPGSPSIMLCGDDGGIQRTTNNLAATVAWSQINSGYRTYQYYYVDIDPRNTNAKVIGGAQDNGSTRNIGGTGVNFESVLGGDGVSVGLSNLIAGTQYEYVGFQLGTMIRRASTLGANFGTDITPSGEDGTGLFVTLFKVDPDNTERLFYANDNALYRTTTGSTVTTTVGVGVNDWTNMTGVATAVGAANDISCLATTRGTYSAATSSLFFGTSNGNIFRLDNPGGVAAATAPVNIRSAAMPAANVSSISVNPRNDDTVLVTFSNYNVTSIWWTGNANSATPTWASVEGPLTLPSIRSSAIHAVPNSQEVQYFVGTSVGLYTVTGLPAITTWTQEGPTTIGNAVVSSLAFRPIDGNLLAGTHGYGMWKTALNLFPLPIEYTFISASLQNKAALVEWTTAIEYNSKQFELEKSYDGINFRRIATIAAAGTSYGSKHYSYADTEPLSEINYYRIRSVDLDGTHAYTNIVTVKVPGAKQDLIVSGNPFRESVVVRLVKPVQQGGQVRLYDINGRNLLTMNLIKGQQQVHMVLPGIKPAAGVYLLEAVIDGSRHKKQLLKQ